MLSHETIEHQIKVKNVEFQIHLYIFFLQEIRPVRNISVKTTKNGLTANWENLDCVDHYVMRLERVSKIELDTDGIKEYRHNIKEQYFTS